MIKSTKNPWHVWKSTVFSFQRKLLPNISKSYQTYPNVAMTAIGGISVGVKRFECGISGGLNENAPTDRRGIYEAFGSHRHVVIPIVAKSIINFNSYARLHV
jgi:hypothetical protein